MVGHLLTPRPVLDHVLAAWAEAGEQGLERGDRLIAEVGRVIDDQVEGFIAELVLDDLGHGRPVGLVDPEVRAHPVLPAIRHERGQGDDGLGVVFDRDEPAGTSDQRRQHGGAPLSDAKFDDVAAGVLGQEGRERLSLGNRLADVEVVRGGAGQPAHGEAHPADPELLVAHPLDGWPRGLAVFDPRSVQETP